MSGCSTTVVQFTPVGQRLAEFRRFVVGIRRTEIIAYPFFLAWIKLVPFVIASIPVGAPRTSYSSH